MANLPPNSDYSDKDFDSLSLRLQSLVRSVFPEWTDWQTANFGVMLVEAFSFVGDVLTFYQDNQARESRIPSATQRKSLLALSKLIGYVPTGVRAATTDVQFTVISGPPIADVVLPPGTVVQTKDVTNPIEFQLLAPVVIAAGSDPAVAVGSVENSKSYNETFAPNSLPNQEIKLEKSPFIETSEGLVIGGLDWERVDNFLSSASSDLHYVVVVDSTDKATLRFGNNINGKIPTDTIYVSYKVGGGASGNVDAGSITVIESEFTDVDSNTVYLSCANASAASGGQNRQTISQIKERAPESIRTAERSVAREDFEINAKGVTGVARALMLTSDEDSAIDENTGILFIVPTGGGTPSAALKDEVLNHIRTNYPPTLTFRLSVQDPIYRVVNIKTSVHLDKNYTAATVRTAISRALTAYFAILDSDGVANPAMQFGYGYQDSTGAADPALAYSDLVNVINDIDGVRKISDGSDSVLLNGLKRDVAVGLREFPVLGTVTILNAATGNAL